jgi:DNA-directed RNA polymerase specialized sigma24 family protein
VTREELDHLVTDRYTELLRYTEKLTRDKDKARDVLHDTIARVYGKTTYLKAKSGYGWLARCVKYVWQRQVRQAQRRGKYYGGQVEPERYGGGEELVGVGAEPYLVTLSPLDRLIVRERVVKKTSKREVAEVLGLKPSTVEMKKKRALMKLRRKFGYER